MPGITVWNESFWPNLVFRTITRNTIGEVFKKGHGPRDKKSAGCRG